MPRHRGPTVALAVVLVHLAVLCINWRTPLTASPTLVWVALDPGGSSISNSPRVDENGASMHTPLPAPLRGPLGEDAGPLDALEPLPAAFAAVPAAAAPPNEPMASPLVLPAPFQWDFSVHRAQGLSHATLQFEITQQQGLRYDLRWSESGSPSGPLVWHSQGEVGALGLLPERLVESRQDKARRAINVERVSGWVSASTSTHRERMVAGVQDRLSWLVQFLSLVRGRASAWQSGDGVTLAVAQWDGRVVPWRFVLRAGGAGVTGLSVWERAPAQDYDVGVEVWLNAQAEHRLQRVVWRWPPPAGVVRWEAAD